MEIIASGAAGTLESGDILVEVEPGDGQTVIELTSTVKSLYGRQIEAVIRQTLADMAAANVRVCAHDKGALDCTVAARVKAALLRAAGAQEYVFSAEGRRA